MPFSETRRSYVVTPLETSLAGATGAYLLAIVVTKEFVSIDAAATLLNFPALAIAVPVVLSIYTAVWLFWFAPSSSSNEERNENPVAAMANIMRTRESVAVAARWWHHLLAATVGFVFGATLAVVLIWAFA